MKAKRTKTPKLAVMPPPMVSAAPAETAPPAEKSPVGMSASMPAEEADAAALFRSLGGSLVEQLAEIQRGVTELTTRCESAEDRADEILHGVLDLMDALDSLDVIAVLEQHTPDWRRYEVDNLAAEIRSLWRMYWDVQ
jgi:hypothetical protein